VYYNRVIERGVVMDVLVFVVLAFIIIPMIKNKSCAIEDSLITREEYEKLSYKGNWITLDKGKTYRKI